MNVIVPNARGICCAGYHGDVGSGACYAIRNLLQYVNSNTQHRTMTVLITCSRLFYTTMYFKYRVQITHQLSYFHIIFNYSISPTHYSHDNRYMVLGEKGNRTVQEKVDRALSAIPVENMQGKLLQRG